MSVCEDQRLGVTENYPTYRKSHFVSIPNWLYGKRQDDGAEGLWRIQDTLYDFSKFASMHPGGKFWLEVTKGTDITEAFEIHHISNVPKNLLSHYAIRQATQKRNYKFTMHESGFYKVLKSRVQAKLANVKTNKNNYSNLVHDVLLLATALLSMASAVSWRILFTFFSALCLCWLSITSHNFFHRRNNWRMYTFNLTLMNFNAWRVSHGLSHHIYPNSLLDLEMSMFEPFLCWIPDKKLATKLQRYIMLFLQPIVYALIFPMHFFFRIVISLLHTNIMYWHDLIGFILPIIMYIVSQETMICVVQQWLIILSLSSFIFGMIGLNAAHHAPEIFHDGDARREDKDWGLYQIDTIIDRSDVKGSLFLVLTHFGDHALHHLFPTLDHGLLPQLYDIFFQTLTEYKCKIHAYNHIAHIIGQNKQLLRTKRNTKKPNENLEQKTN